MKKRIVVSVLVLCTLLAGSFVFASPGPRERCGSDKERVAMTYEQHEERMAQRLERMNVLLELTEVQQEQVKSLLNQQWQKRQELRDQMKAARNAMRETRTAEVFNESDFRTKAGKLAELKIEKKVLRAKMKQELYALLTPEQQKKSDALNELMRGKGKRQNRQRV